MKYVKVIDGVVVQKQPNAQEGFIQAPDDVVCGWLYDGTTYTAPVIPGPTEAELQEELRSIRDRMLKESDAYMLPDYPLSSTKTEVENFRQALRDLPGNTDFSAISSMSDVSWPIDPEGEIIVGV